MALWPRHWRRRFHRWRYRCWRWARKAVGWTNYASRVSDTYDGEVRRSLRALVALIEPAMIIIFGALVGFIALAMLQAIYSINTSAF